MRKYGRLEFIQYLKICIICYNFLHLSEQNHELPLEILGPKDKLILKNLFTMNFITTEVKGALWQYGLWSYQAGGTKLERFLPKNQHTQRKLLNFENWVNGEVSKIGHYFRKKK